jgi:hypothetical protein
MQACRIDDGQVIRGPAKAVVESEWKKLVSAKKLGSTFADGARYVVACFETKSGTQKNAIATPAGAWMLNESEARSFGFEVPAWKVPMGTSR